MECPKDNESDYATNFVCSINNDRNESFSVTAYADLIIPLNYVELHYIFMHRTTNKVVLNVTFDYCSSFGNAHPFVQLILNTLKKYSKNLIHRCPYSPQTRIGVEKWPFDANIPVMALIQHQKGDYKITFNAKDRHGKLIFYVHIYAWVAQKKKPKNNRNG